MGNNICSDGSGLNGVGPLQPQAGMWDVAVGWLTGAIPAASGGNPFCNRLAQNSTVWHCDFTKNGTPYSMVWDTFYSASAATQTNYCAANFGDPYVCGSTAYAVSPQFGRWVDLSGTVRSITKLPLVIGLNPILLEP
jgi:hypothetical protein